MSDKKIPPQLRRMVEAHYALLWQSKSIYSEKEILQRLPPSLATPVIEHLYEDIMVSAALFTQLKDPAVPHGREIITNIALELNHEVANQGVTVMREAEYANKMFLVVTGEVEIYRRFTWTASFARLSRKERTRRLRTSYDADQDEEHEDVRSLGRLGPRGFFGERSVMRIDGSASQNVVTTRTVVARTACTFYTLTKPSLELLRGQYPQLDQCMLQLEAGLVTEFDKPQMSHSLHTDGDGTQPSRSAIGTNNQLEARMSGIEQQLAELQEETGAKLDALMGMMEEMQANELLIQTR